MPPLPASTELQQIAEWLANAYHIACASKPFYKKSWFGADYRNIL